MLIPAATLMESYEQALRESIEGGKVFGLPVNMQHDMHRPVGWSQTLGLHIDGSMVRTVGQMALPETEEEKIQLSQKTKYFWRQFHTDGTETHREELILRANPLSLANARTLRREAITLISPNVAANLYPEFFTNGYAYVDKDGLVDYRYLLQHTEQIQPGVFREPKRDLILFAHRFFRRSQSHVNKLNAYFLERFHATSSEHPEISMRLRLDPDAIGHPATSRTMIELEYWRGPHFSDDISSIPDGVTEHKGDDDDRFYHGIDRTQIWWKVPESRKNGSQTIKFRTLEVEELIENPSWGISADHFGCRYAHAEYSYQDKTITHFDGAIRAYEATPYLQRIETSIDRAGKNTDYTKLFRFDGSLPIAAWKRLLTDYFMGNKLIPEYLGAPPEKETVPTVANEEPPNKTPGLGVAAFVALKPHQGGSSTHLWREQQILRNGHRVDFAETGIGAVHTYLHTRFQLTELLTGGFDDGILNLARLHIDTSDPLGPTLSDELTPLADALQQDVDQDVIRSASISMTWEYDCYMVAVTIAGQADKIVSVLRQLPTVVNPSQLPSEWIEQLAKLIKSLGPGSSDWNWFRDFDLGKLSIPRQENDSIQVYGSPNLLTEEPNPQSSAVE
jgi:hypothetical protein